MKFWPLWTRVASVPCSLLVISLALVAIAVPVESAEAEDNLKPPLTPDNFESTIASGYWFVEHFSPWCPHCRAFAPMWAQINQEYEGSGVNMAQVNCAVNGDLCSKNKINGYPQMNLYKDGEFVVTFKGSRDHDRIADFLKEHTSVTLSVTTPEPVAPPPPPPPPEPIVEDPVVSEEPVLVYNPTGEVVKLTPATFTDATKEGNVFVKFFAPWCGHCKKLAPIWETLARDMQSKMTIAEVNCEDHKGLCAKQDIDGYPMLHYYAPGGQKTVFTGSRKLDSLKAWADRVVKPATQVLEFEKLSDVVRENPVLYLFLHQPGDSRILNTITKAARPLLGAPLVFTSTSNAFLDHISIPRTSESPYPLLLALKDGDSVSPTSVFPISSKTPLTEISSWMMSNRLPISSELGDGTFQEIMNAPSKPLVVLASVPSDGFEREQLITKIKEIGAQWRRRGDSEKMVAERDVVFAWMDGQKWAKWMKSMYGVKEVGGVVVADHGKLLYFDTEPTGKKTTLTAESIFVTLQGAMTGKSSPKHSENTVERMARYLNDKLQWFESAIKANPKTTIFMFVLVIIGFIYFIKRTVFDDNGDQYYYHPSGKEGRLD